MRQPTIYVETSVWSQALAEDAPELRESTLLFFAAAKKNKLPLFVSEVVFAEFSKAVEELGDRLRELVRDLSPTMISLGDEANRLAAEYHRAGIVPISKLDDARHVAVAVVHELDILVSWNYKHLVNIKRKEAFHHLSSINGYLKPLQIVTPPEVGYGYQQES
jgi:hypothetical protein